MKQVLAFLLLFISINAFSQTGDEILRMTVNKDGVAINAPTPAASAILDITSTNKGMLIPRMTTTQRDAITSPSLSLLIFNTTTSAYNYWTGSAWATFGGSSSVILFASQFGAIDDANISFNSSSYGTNNTNAIQSLLNRATTGPIHIIVDGHYSVAGLKIYSNTEFSALPGCGLILRPFSSKAIINSNSVTSGSPDSNISIHDIVLNCNGFNSAGTAIQAHDTSTEGWVTGVRIAHAKNITLQNVKLYKAATFHTHMWDIDEFVIDGCVADAGPTGLINTDGFHFNGNTTNGRITNNYCRNYDDHIALNADDVFGYDATLTNVTLPVYGTLAGHWINGPISNIYMNNNIFTGGFFGYRLLSGTSLLDKVTICNARGTTDDYGVVIDNYVYNPASIGGGNGNIGTVVFDGYEVTSPARVFSDPFPRGQIVIGCDFNTIIFKNVVRNDFAIANFPTINFYANHHGKVLMLDGYESHNTTSNATAHINISNGCTVDYLRVTNASIRNDNNLTTPLLQVGETASVGKVQMNTCYFNNISATGAYLSPSTLIDSNTASISNVLEIGTTYFNWSTFLAANGTSLPSYTPLSGPAFANSQDTWEIQSNRARAATFASNNPVALTETGHNNQTITATGLCNASGASLQIWGRATNPSNAVVCHVSSSSITLFNIVAGSVSSITYYTTTRNSSDNTYQMIFAGSTVSVKLNGVTVISPTALPTTQSGTKAGIGASAIASSSECTFSSFTVQ